MTRRGIVGLAVVWLTGAALLADQRTVKVTPVVSDGRVLATFAAPGAWTDEARQLVETGLLLTFSYDVELRRPFTLWFDATLASTTVGASVKFDTLTGGYQVSRLRDGRVIQSERREQQAEVRDWMTLFEQVLLEPASPLEPNAEYYVRVRLYTSPRRSVSVWSLWPFGRDDGSGRAVFTFVR